MYYDDEPVYIEEGYYDFDDLADYVLTNIDEEVLLEISNALANKVTLARTAKVFNSAQPRNGLTFVDANDMNALTRNIALRRARQLRLNKNYVNSKGFFNTIKKGVKARSDAKWLNNYNKQLCN